MFVPSELDLLPGLDGRSFSEKTGEPFDNNPKPLISELEEKFRHMREECARTMALMRSLRTSPLYRYASIDSHTNGD